MVSQPLTLHPPAATDSLTARIKLAAADYGLSIARVTSAEPFEGLERQLQEHIAGGHVAGMDWFTSDRATVAANPRALHPTARSIIAVAMAYWQGDPRPDDGIPRGMIARYAWGRDYHRTLKRRMAAFHAAIEEMAGRPVEARLLVDTARISDRAVAARSGLGWYGKNACIISPGHSSWLLLGELILDLELQPDAPLEKDCGRCSICLDRCPTGAIVAPYTVHSPRCISFQTIEQRGVIPIDLRQHMGTWVFGCDICQEVCPYTKAARFQDDPDIQPAHLDNAYPSLTWLLTMTEEQFRERYQGTAVLRAKRRGLARNAAISAGNSADDSLIPILAETLAGHDEELVRAHAAWALGALGGRTARAALERYRGRDTGLVDCEVKAALGRLARS